MDAAAVLRHLRPTVLTTLVVSPFIALSVSNAVLIDRGQHTTDTATELDWLKLDRLVGYSYEEVLNGAGGYLHSGWRYATQEEVVNLFTEYIGPSNGLYFGVMSAQSTSYFQGAENLVIALGMNLAFNDSRATTNFTGSSIHQISVQGFVVPSDAPQALAEATAVIDFAPTDYAMPGPFGRWGVFDEDRPYGTPNVSSFLVRETPRKVSEPDTLGLLLIGSLCALAVLTPFHRRAAYAELGVQ